MAHKWTMRGEQWYDPEGNPHPTGPKPAHAMKLKGDIGSCASAWPVASDAAGCHPSQIKEYRKFLSDKGVQANYTPDGRLLMESREHKKAVLKALDMQDRSRHGV